MLTADFPAFEAEIRRLEKIFGKALDDEGIQIYWGALKDQSLAQFKRFVVSHEKGGKFFPKPFELRAKEERAGVVRDAAADASFKSGEARCIRNLEELRRENPDKWLVEVRMRKLDRLIAITDPSDLGYQEILNAWRRARGIHVGPNE